MFHRILVPLDGSQRAEQALPVAIRLAQATQGTLVLLRAVAPLPILTPYPEAMAARQRAMKAESEEAHTYLEQVADFTEIRGIRVETEVIEVYAAAAILTIAQARQIDLIVLCSHGYTGMKRWMLGSVAEKVVRHAPVPVLLLRENSPAFAEMSSHTNSRIHVLVPLDGSERAKTVIVPAIQLLSAFMSPGSGSLRLTLATVLPINQQMRSDEREQLVHRTKEYLSALTEQTRKELRVNVPQDLNCSVTSIVTSDEDIAEGIICLAEECEDTEEPGTRSTELIAMATHGYSGLNRWMLGSITERVVHASKLPMLIVRSMNMRNEGMEMDIPTIAEVPII